MAGKPSMSPVRPHDGVACDVKEGGAIGLQGGLQVPVHPLDDPVGLGVVAGRGPVENV